MLALRATIGHRSVARARDVGLPEETGRGKGRKEVSGRRGTGFAATAACGRWGDRARDDDGVWGSKDVPAG